MAWWILILQVVSGGNSLTQATLNMPLKEALQEYVVCRKDFNEHQNEFEDAMNIGDLTLRRHALESLRVQVLAKCGVRPKIGPHAGQVHKVIRVHPTGHLNITPERPGKDRYRLGAAKAQPKDVERAPLHEATASKGRSSYAKTASRSTIMELL
jgi:hypothetical protein